MTVRVRRWVAVSALLAGMQSFAATTVPLPVLERVTVLAAPKAIADFELTDHNGKQRKLSSFHGAPTLVFFGFTHCPDICPSALGKLRLLQSSNGGELKGARVVLISVDGERDTPSRLNAYLTAFPSVVGMTGDPRTVSNIATRFSAVAFKEQPNAKGGYGYFHSSQVFLLDKSGRLRASFSDATVANMATVTRLLVNE